MSARQQRRKEAKAAKRKGVQRKAHGRMLPNHLTLAELAPILSVFANITSTIMSGRVTQDEIGGLLSHVHVALRVQAIQCKDIPPELVRAVATLAAVRHLQTVDEDDVLALDKATEIATAIILKAPDTLIRQASEALELQTYLNEESMYEV